MVGFSSQRMLLKSMTIHGIEVRLLRVPASSESAFCDFCIEELSVGESSKVFRRGMDAAELEYEERCIAAAQGTVKRSAPPAKDRPREERRRESRFSVDFEATCMVRREGGGSAGIADLRNISRQGVSIRVDEAYRDLNELLREALIEYRIVEITARAQQSGRRARVVWAIRSEEAAEWSYGLELVVP